MTVEELYVHDYRRKEPRRIYTLNTSEHLGSVITGVLCEYSLASNLSRAQ